MEIAKIAELLEPFLAASATATAQAPEAAVAQKSVAISKSQLEHISTYIDLLLRWNLRINLTSIRQPEEIVTRHFGESLFTAQHLFPTPGRDPDSTRPISGRPKVTDIGSGAGFPGLPIKLWNPSIHLTLIESNHKKVAFLREVVRTLSFSDVAVFAGRSEAFPKDQAGADVVTLRAVEQLNSVLPAAADLLRPGGRLAILVGESQIPSIEKLLTGFDWDETFKLPLARNRALMIGRKELRS